MSAAQRPQAGATVADDDLSRPMDVVVVGAGVVGAAAAHRLSERGVSVLVVDADLPGRATAAGAGIVTPLGVGVDPVPDLTAAAVEHYRARLVPTLADEHGLPTGYARVGLLMLAEPAAEGAAAESATAALTAIEQRAGDLEVQRTVAPADAWPEFGRARPVDAVFVADAARVDGRLLRTALLTAASRQGARLMSGTATVVRRDGRAQVSVNGQPVPAGQVLVAAGAWTGEVLAAFAAAPATHPDRGQILHLGLDDGDVGSRPMLQTVRGEYVLGFPGRVVSGATHEPEAGFDYRVTAGGQARLLAQTLRILPGLAAASVLETRVGFRPAAADGRPAVGPVGDVANLWVASGMGSVGLALGPLLGARAADGLLAG